MKRKIMELFKVARMIQNVVKNITCKLKNFEKIGLSKF